MPKVRQPYDEERYVPALGDRLVKPGEEVLVDDDQLAGFLEAGWIPGDSVTRQIGEQLLADGKITVLAAVPAKAKARAGKDEGGQT